MKAEQLVELQQKYVNILGIGSDETRELTPEERVREVSDTAEAACRLADAALEFYNGIAPEAKTWLGLMVLGQAMLARDAAEAEKAGEETAAGDPTPEV